jgi:uncharacterized membrane protein
MIHDAAVAVHVIGGGIAIVTGYAALLFRKGDQRHRAAGKVFFVAMLVMAAFATVLAALGGERLNIIAGAFTLYFVATAWGAVLRPEGTIGRAEIGGCMLAVGIACLGLVFGLQAAASENGMIDGVPPQVAYVFAAVAALAAAADLKVVLRGGIAGAPRIARHLWRMCTALFIAAGSFFLGQMDVIPKALHGPHLFVLALAPLAALLFWMLRVHFTSAFKPPPAAT